MKKKLFFMMIALISCFSMTVHAQKGRIISGNVSDDVAPLIGVGVMIQGTNTGVVTDNDGNYTIQNVKPTDVLVFSYIGYATEEIEVGKSATINVVMKADARTIDDAVVVAVGYGDVRRRDLTGSIGKANVSDIVKIPVTNVEAALNGRVAGVQVTSQDGGPGDNFNIVIRGAGSLTGSTAPLYVVDGFPQETSTMSALNPNDIESIDNQRGLSKATDQRHRNRPVQHTYGRKNRQYSHNGGLSRESTLSALALALAGLWDKTFGWPFRII